ncbi:hypothetical protein H257_18236 [Aphanomyces astaci]|uniref:Uncharacterized protein n=1 Tax=Aphanomyces astaci TaxID=112090 RepID=W4FBV9_APHAT|nr:hypothetical protein H257_18236 [Aphanomyces astaci]ETV64967.1 hypothetical protein H257_18236 [Aphanomyces astaci]|eukprot:XP_009845557.1 hypothetical protein H257_18236 [Aphanomyces astaci]
MESNSEVSDERNGDTQLNLERGMTFHSGSAFVVSPLRSSGTSLLLSIRRNSSADPVKVRHRLMGDMEKRPPTHSTFIVDITVAVNHHRRTSLSAAAATLQRPRSSTFSTLHRPPRSPQIAAGQCSDDNGVLYNTPPSTIFAALHHPPPHNRRGKAVECSENGEVMWRGAMEKEVQ